VFPHRDDPFIEDMGEALRFYSGSAYVHGDDADALAARSRPRWPRAAPARWSCRISAR
jgi:hypothetical protein